MPWRAPSDATLRHTRSQSHQRYNAERRAVRGPDPRSTARWRRVRAQVLAEAPLCADPYGIHRAEGRVEVATEVDHRQGVWERPDLVYDPANLTPMCTPCHARKSQAERQGRGDQGVSNCQEWTTNEARGEGES